MRLKEEPTMRLKDVKRGRLAPALAAALLAACGSSSGGGHSTQGAVCAGGTGQTLNATCTPTFTQSTNTPGSIQVTFSGETLGVAGLPFQPVNQGDPVFVDGWNVTFDEILVVLGNVRVAPGATEFPVQSQVNAPVATMAGPFVVDMHKPSGFVGKDGVEPAGAIFVWNSQDNGQAFSTTTRYSFSYDVMKAAYPATQINLTPDQFTDYGLMVQNGWSKLYRGTATYVGTCNWTTYPQGDPSGKVQALFGALPTTVHFMFGWNDATSMINCANPDFGSDENVPANWGVQPTSSGAVIAQITLHVDHAFWDIVKQEGAPLRFDPIAAWAPPSTTALAPLDLRTLAAKPLATTFSDGVTPIPDRGLCQNAPGYTQSDQSNPGQVTLNTNGVPASDLPGIANFMAFSAQSQMHLNANGLCYIVGQQASDPYYAPNIH